MQNRGGNMENQSHSTESNDTIKHEPAVSAPIGSEFHYAGFWMRFWAYLLDLAVVASLNSLLIKPIFHLADIPQGHGFFSPYTIVTVIIFYGYFVLMTKYFGQTLGKMVFGLKVVSLKDSTLTWPVVLFREGIGRYISKTVFLLGYLLVAFLPKKQGAHDYYADTTVIHEGTISR